MKYELINKELRIAACGIADLTMAQVQSFLKQWDDGSNIGTLTLFFDREAGYVVLNRDNKDYQRYLDIAERYLGADAEERKEIEDLTPEGLKQTILVLNNFLMRRKIDEGIFQAKKNYVDYSERIVINNIIDVSSDQMGAAYMAFRYGVICGKRSERARRKKTA